MKVNCSNHLKHPFSQDKIQIKTWQKWVAVAGFLLTPFLIIPGFIAFYGLSYAFKHRTVKQLPSTQNFNVFIPNHPQRYHSNAPQTSTSEGSDSSSTSAQADSLRKSAKLPNFPISLLADLHRQNAIVEIYKDLENATCEDEEIACLKALETEVNLNHNWTDYLSFLHDHDTATFSNLFTHALSTNKEIVQNFLNQMNPTQLEEHLKTLDDLILHFGSQDICSHKKILSYFIPYFERMFQSNTRESASKELNFPEKEYDFFVSLINKVLFKKDLKINAHNFTDLFQCADKYDIPFIKEECQDWIIKHIKRFDNISRDILYDFCNEYKLDDIKFLLIQTVLKESSKSFSIENKNKLALWLSDKNLKLGNLRITSILIQHLKDLPINSIKMSNCAITNNGMQLISSMPLQSINIASCRLSNKALDLLKISKIPSFNVRYCDMGPGNAFLHSFER